ncbi:MAG TPA: hypothetical protein VFW28_11880 [Micropepsaceae bacterium]|nr:hypothetical protein [Micropepsaceae bacterium]
MRRAIAAGAAALGLILAVTTAADAAARFGGFRGGGFRGGFGGGFRGGAFIGPRFGFGGGFYDPFWWPGYYPWGYPWAFPYYAPQVVVRYAPSGYLPAAAAPQQQFWYRCGNPEGYFPYIQNCMTGWERVPVAPGGALTGAPPPPGAPAGPTPNGPVYDPVVPGGPPPAQR